MPKTPDRRRPSYDELAALVVRQMNTIEEQRQTIARLEATVDRLSARVAELERRQSRNSGNSSLPPSSDIFSRPEKKPPPTSGRKRGRQPGAPGAGLAMAETPDEVEDHVPAACGGCGKEVSAGDSVGYARRQVRDIPLVTVTVTEHRAHRCKCGGCGRITSALMPAQVAGAPSSYGPNLRALTAYLLVFQHVPVERCAQLIADVTGARVSPGWVSSVLAEAAGLVADSITVMHVLHVDETTTKIGAVRRWLHVAATDRLTLLGLGERSREGANSLGVLPQFRGVLVHDSLSLYNGYGAARHQRCGAHYADFLIMPTSPLLELIGEGVVDDEVGIITAA
ncbi:transposase [Nonomuraea sp. NPDC050153]|uniref:IS66 family transposase n=1 Tax=Nonomuraea sp. NPDC050153 TaxID=3364359 RepID=UPI00379559FC